MKRVVDVSSRKRVSRQILLNRSIQRLIHNLNRIPRQPTTDSECKIQERGKGGYQLGGSTHLQLFAQMPNKMITFTRIEKETQAMQKEAIPSVLVRRDKQSIFIFHFCFYDLAQDYHNGYYQGVLELPEDYPFAPPKIKFLTNNGRFEVNKSICTTFTHYHKETWSSSWNIRTILTAMISFMYSDDKGVGGISEPPTMRRALAARSLAENLRNGVFVEYFGQELVKMGRVSKEELEAVRSFKVEEKADKGEKKRKRVRNQPKEEPKQEQQVPAEAPPTLVGNVTEEDSLNRKRQRQADQEQELGIFDILTKKRKLDYGEIPEDEEEDQLLERQKTAQPQLP